MFCNLCGAFIEDVDPRGGEKLIIYVVVLKDVVYSR
jgi:hypothetical protein